MIDVSLRTGSKGRFEVTLDDQLIFSKVKLHRFPNPGEIVLYPGGVSETEILLAYGYVNFASKAGQLAGNHFATIVAGNEHLRELGKRFLWEGAQEIVFREQGV